MSAFRPVVSSPPPAEPDEHPALHEHIEWGSGPTRTRAASAGSEVPAVERRAGVHRRPPSVQLCCVLTGPLRPAEHPNSPMAATVSGLLSVSGLLTLVRPLTPFCRATAPGPLAADRCSIVRGPLPALHHTWPRTASQLHPTVTGGRGQGLSPHAVIRRLVAQYRFGRRMKVSRGMQPPFRVWSSRPAVGTIADLRDCACGGGRCLWQRRELAKAGRGSTASYVNAQASGRECRVQVIPPAVNSPRTPAKRSAGSAWLTTETRSMADAQAAKRFILDGTIRLSFLPVQRARSALQHIERRQRDCS